MGASSLCVTSLSDFASEALRHSAAGGLAVCHTTIGVFGLILKEIYAWRDSANLAKIAKAAD
jgi:hypothetical protein